jgi:murein L,D-transpeptidase YcbB/YkuD
MRSGGAFVKAGLKAAVAAAVLAMAGCDNISIGGGGGGGSGAEAPQVAPEELRAAVQDERVRRFYEARQWRAAWNGEQEQALVAALRDAGRHGLDPRRYLRGVGDSAAGAAREAALSLAALNFAEALARGQADPARLHEVYEIPRPEADVTAGLAQAVEQGNVGQWLGGLAPQDAEYRALSEAYLRYSEAASREQAPAVTAGRGIRVGDRDPRVPAIAAALRSHGYLAAPAPAQPQQQQQQAEAQQPKQAQPAAEPTRYTEEMAAAVRRVQEDYGINPDGVIGSGTLDILNATARDRARQLAVNLERRRWLARQAPATRIDVNTAAAFLEYHRDGRLADTRRVMVGQPEWETPPLQSPIVRLVANPPWTVPESIEQEELLPKGAAYLARNNFTRNRNGRLVQEPGPESALGLVKLDMSNRHAIYLHDTPAKAGFARAERHMSHGCVRVQDAVGFAAMLAEHDGRRDQFDRALARRNGEDKPQEGAVQLRNPIPVRLLYHSVYLDRSGRLLFRPDPYGWDETVAEALGLAARQRPSVRRHTGDIGP